MKRPFQPDKATIVGVAERIRAAITDKMKMPVGDITNERWWASFHLDHGRGRYRISVEFIRELP